MAAIIIGCEIAFWVFVLAGLLCRYVLKAKKLGAALLLATPLIDVALLMVTVLDLRDGAVASTVHGIAAIYIGVSLVYGHSMIRWADVRFAHRFAGGPAPERPPAHGQAHARRERIGWAKHCVAWAIGCAVLYAMVLLVGNEERTSALMGILRFWSIVLAIDFAYSFSFTLWPKRAKGTA
ncbi:hypothetical protein [Paenibacillus methanolicus]|uniref:Membrane protein YmcC n=1 Tax=Paenibacillus methanolicus TaxID=582686 RepID=A0A5S5BR34_9BACL|nr:hypothetical protein [Paenibacillus methanolicus]TYP69394.1 hypothetical protein BCM02_11554 [Paenibacillus methanolicus]